MEISPNMLVFAGLVLVIGFLLGLMLSGRGKYKQLWREERRERERVEKERDAQIATANARIAELERARPAVAPASTVTAVDARPEPVYPEPREKGEPFGDPPKKSRWSLS